MIGVKPNAEALRFQRLQRPQESAAVQNVGSNRGMKLASRLDCSTPLHNVLDQELARSPVSHCWLTEHAG